MAVSVESALDDRSRRVLPPSAEEEKRIPGRRPSLRPWFSRAPHAGRRLGLLSPAVVKGIILLDSSRCSELRFNVPRYVSDVEDNTVPEVAEEVEVPGDAPKGQMSVLDALKGVLKLALMHDGLARGLREASKALDRRQAHMCVLNEQCEEEAYKKLVIALCSEHKIPLIKFPMASSSASGLVSVRFVPPGADWCVLDREGNARKVVNCSCVVVKDWGEESQERSILLNYFQTEQIAAYDLAVVL
ncbi:hypothetical protein G7046_g294 [Stylonectria norvegica]|nr:hypothetical protein G7046_g294 [Stylonectria norvegica]